MAGSFRKYEIIHHSSSPLFFSESTTSIFPAKPFSFLNPFFEDDLTISPLDLLNPKPNPIFPPFCESITDLVEFQTTPFFSNKRVIHRTRVNSSELYLQALCDRVSSLESKFDRLLEVKKEKKLNEVDRKYSWTAEIKGGIDRKYKWTAEIEADDEKKGKKGDRKYQWVSEFKGDNDAKRTYTWKATIGGEKNKKEKKVKSKGEKGSCAARIVEIEEPSDHGAVVLRQKYT